MISITTSEKIIYTVVSEKITDKDFDQLKSQLEKLIVSFSKIRWYYEMRDFHGWDPKPFFRDTRYSLEHTKDFEKIAMVGEKQWQEWMTDLMKPFTASDIKYFDVSEKEEAKKWIAL